MPGRSPITALCLSLVASAALLLPSQAMAAPGAGATDGASGGASDIAVAEASQRKKAKLRVVVRGPAGVPVTATARKGRSKIVVAKKASGTSRKVTKSVAPGRWKVTAPSVLVGKRYYVAKPVAVKAVRGRTRTVTLRYKQVTGLATDATATGLSTTEVKFGWKKPAKKSKVVVRRSTGSVPPTTRKSGKAVKVSGTSVRDRGVTRGKTYSYSVFTQRKKSWYRSSVLTVSTPDPKAVESLRFVAATETLLPAASQVKKARALSAGRLAVTLSTDAPRLGQAVLVPRSPAAPYGYMGRVSSVGTNGEVVLSHAPLDALFDVVEMNVRAPAASAAIAAAGDHAAGEHKAKIMDRWGEVDLNGCKPTGPKSPTDVFGVHLDKSFEVKTVSFTLRKKEVRYFPDVPYGFDLDGGVAMEAELSGGMKLETGYKCRKAMPSVPIQVGPLPLTIVFEGAVRAEFTSGIEMKGLRASGSFEQDFTAELNVVDGGFTASSSGPGGDLDIAGPAISGSASASLGLDMSLIIGPGGGTKPLGAVAGMKGTLTPVEVGLKVEASEEPGDRDVCYRATVTGKAALYLHGEAWIGGKSAKKSIELPLSPWTWNYLSLKPDLQDLLTWCKEGSPVITTKALPTAKFERPYAAQLRLGDSRAGTWSLESGRLPDGVTLDPQTGRISGTPTTSGVHALTVRFVDDKGQTDTAEYELTVRPKPSEPAIHDAELDEGVKGRDYADQILVSPRTPGTWKVVSGALPAGLDIDEDSGALSGVPTGPVGRTTFTVRFTDEYAQSTTRELFIDVHPELRCPSPEKCVTISGTAHANGSPAGIKLTLVSPWGDDVVSDEPDDAGRFSLLGLPIAADKAYTVRATLPRLEDCQYWIADTRVDTTTASLTTAGDTDASLKFVWRSASKDPCPGGGGGGGPVGGGSQGDPHMTTFDGVRYDFHAQGEYVAARSTTDDFEVRFQFRKPPGQRVTWNGGAAVTVGSSILTFGDADPHTAAGQLRASLDGQRIPDGTAPVDLPGGAKLTRTARTSEVTWADGTRLELREDGARGESTEYRLVPSSKRAGALEGLLGNFDGSPANDLRTADGTPVDVWKAASLYDEFGGRWEVPRNDSWFTDPLVNVTPGEVVSLATLDAEVVAAAFATCRTAGVEVPAALERCALDVAVTGLDELAAGYARTQDDLDGTIAASLANGGSSNGALSSGVARGGTLAQGAALTYTIALQAGQAFDLTVPTCPQRGTLQVALVAPSGEVVATSSGEGCGSIRIDALGETGTHQVRVTDSAGYAGAVSIRAFVLPSRPLAASRAGDPWTSDELSGEAVLAQPSYGCGTVDVFGNCDGSNWAVIPGAPWIWATPMPGGLRAATFTRTVENPADEPRTCIFRHSVDADAATGTLNGAPLALSRNHRGVSTPSITLQPGENTFVFTLDNGAVPSANDPGGIAWAIDSCVETPRITSISTFGAGKVPAAPIVVEGTGFGPSPALTPGGTTPKFSLNEPATGWEACTNGNIVGCHLEWSGDGKRITLTRFDDDYGRGSWSFVDGDVVVVKVVNSFGTASDTCTVVVGAGPTDCTKD